MHEIFRRLAREDGVAGQKFWRVKVLLINVMVMEVEMLLRLLINSPVIKTIQTLEHTFSEPCVHRIADQDKPAGGERFVDRLEVCVALKY
jgi:hypothetical protein